MQKKKHDYISVPKKCCSWAFKMRFFLPLYNMETPQQKMMSQCSFSKFLSIRIAQLLSGIWRKSHSGRNPFLAEPLYVYNPTFWLSLCSVTSLFECFQSTYRSLCSDTSRCSCHRSLFWIQFLRSSFVTKWHHYFSAFGFISTV